MEEIKLNLGCASRPLKGYVNIDIDTIDQMKERYPNLQFEEGLEIFQYDIFHLPYRDSEVSEVRSDSMLEHLSYLEEKEFFLEMVRVLRPGGRLVFSVPDFEDTVKKWLSAEDDWREFYRNDDEAIAKQHWFGHYSYATKSRWGYLTASLFGPQNSPGQFHKNCYTEGKIRAMLGKLGFEIVELSFFDWKGDRDRMIQVSSIKK
ncbi:methyltransferase domain-containing protein [Leptospira ognonensis]|uniref:Methyltransferase domain-containing protein n=1 Tax=Leptospira ognonensis TaxID=2484945 RepID=A0A4R9K3M2_9LEPT|nr:methyltransferase domain-containing protein [Leptospira ognonensis]TGL59756.1 methyltransferase domain-containing protein [Leptospira ognonensis]